MRYIREHYGVPAKRGARIRYTDIGRHVWTGRIVSARDGYLRVRVDDPRYPEAVRLLLHPTWNVEYLDDE